MRIRFINTLISDWKVILTLILVMGGSHFLSAQNSDTTFESVQQVDKNLMDQYFQKIEITPESDLLTKDGKIRVHLKEAVQRNLGAVMVEFGPVYDRQTKEIAITSGLVDINGLGYNEYDLTVLWKNGEKITNATFVLPVPSNHIQFKGKTNYFKLYQKYIAAGQLLVHGYTDRNARAVSRSSQTCNYEGYTLEGGYWYKYSDDNVPYGGGGRFFYLESDCSVSPLYGANCTYSPGGIGRRYNETPATQWVEEDPSAALDAETLQKQAWIYMTYGVDNTGEGLMHCIVEGTQCNNADMNILNNSYQSITVDGNISTNVTANGEIEINTNADWVTLPANHGLTVCGGTSASIDGDILKISGSDQRTVRLCSGSNDLNYDFCIKSVNKSDLLYLVSFNQVQQYFFGAKVNDPSDVCASISCNVSITSPPQNQAVCDGGEATFCVEASGSGLSYQWEFSYDGSTLVGDAQESTSGQRCMIATNSGVYFRARVTDQNGCKSYSDWVRITESNDGSLNPSCEYRLQKQVDWTAGDCNPIICADGRLELSVNPNNLASYQWSGPNDFSGSGNANGDILISNCLMPNQAGTYTVTITDDSGCTGTQSITITTKECPCNINATISNKTYLDNNTSNTAQHTFTYQVDISGSNEGGWLLYDVVNGNYNQIIDSGTNNATLNMGPFPVDQNGSVLILMDADNTACRQSLGINMTSCVYTGACACCR